MQCVERVPMIRTKKKKREQKFYNCVTKKRIYKIKRRKKKVFEKYISTRRNILCLQKVKCSTRWKRLLPRHIRIGTALK